MSRPELAEIGGETGTEARMLVASLCPPARDLALVERIVAGAAADLAAQLPDAEAASELRALRWAVETALTRVSALPMLTPRGDQAGEPVRNRREPQL